MSSRGRSLSPAELPIGVVTAFLGAPFFAVVLRTLEGGTVIETRDLWVRFGPVAAVRGLSLRAESGRLDGADRAERRGEDVGAARARRARPRTRARSLIDGQDARRFGRRAVARLVAFVPQKPETPAELTVAEYVLLGRTPHISYLGGEGRRDREAAADGAAPARARGLRRAAARLAQRRRAAARRARPRARAGGAGPAARRADDARSTSAASSSCSSSSTSCAATG